MRRAGISRKKYHPPKVGSSIMSPKDIVALYTPEDLQELKNGLRVQWDTKVTKVSPNKKKPYKSYLIVADTHIPYENKEAVKSVLQLTEVLKPDGFIVLGDYMDMQPISHWNKSKKSGKK